MAILRPISRMLRRPPSAVRVDLVPRTTLVSLYRLPTSLCIQSVRGSLRNFASSATLPKADLLSWDEFLRLRRERRFAGLIGSASTSILGVFVGIQVFGMHEIDPTQTIWGFDPYVMNILFVLGCGVFGWLIGPTMGRGVWNIFHLQQLKTINQVGFSKLCILS